MELFGKMVDSWKLWTIFAKRLILNIWLGSKYAPVSAIFNRLFSIFNPFVPNAPFLHPLKTWENVTVLFVTP